MDTKPRYPSAPAPPQSMAPTQAAVHRAEREAGWRSVDILRAAALVMGLYLALKLLWIAYPLLFAAFLGILFGLPVARGADFLERFRIPRGIGSALVVLGFLGILAGIGTWMAPTLREQTGQLRTALPQAINRVEEWLDRQGVGLLGQLIPEQSGARPQAGEPSPPSPSSPEPAAAAPRTGDEARTPARTPENPARPGGGARGQGGNPLSGLPETLSGQLDAVARYLFSVLSSTVAVLTGMLLIIFLAIYIGSNPDLYRKGMLHMVPPGARARAEQVLTAIGMTLRNWLVAQLVAMLVIGVVTTIGLKLLGVQAALPLGIIAGLLEFIPMVGPILSAIPAVAMGFLDSPQKALFVVLLYVAIQFFENHLLIPMLMKEGVDLPPALTIIGLAIMSVVFGFLGMLVAVPLLAAIVVAVKLLYVEDVMGDDVKTVLDGS